MLALIIVVAIAAITFLGETVNNTFDDVGTRIDAAGGGGTGGGTTP